MSRGYGGFCRKESENDTLVIYAYSSFNWNDKRYCNDERICDGKIIISKKVVLNVLTIYIDRALGHAFSELFGNGGIIIKNCSNTWIKHNKGIDIISIYLCGKILNQYQKEQCFPDKCHYEI